MVRTILVLFASFVLSASCYAEGLDTNADMSGLSDVQKADILKTIATAKARVSGQANAPTVDPKKVAEWVGVAEQVAGLLPVFAEKTGIAAQQVLDSTPGQILLSIVLIKMFWGKIVGILFLTVGTAAWWQMFKRVCLVKNITYAPHDNPVYRWFGGRRKIVEYFTVDEAKGNYDTFFWIWIWTGVLNISLGVIGIII